MGGAIIVVLGIVAVAAAAMGGTDDGEIQEIDQDIAATKEITAALEAAARDADSHIAAAIAKARHGGSHG